MMMLIMTALAMVFIDHWMTFILSMVFIVVIMIITGKHDMEWFEISSFGGLDSLSYMLIFMSVWIFILMAMASSKIFLKEAIQKFYSLTLSILFFTLVMAFSSYNMLSYYIYFEASLIPTFMLILGWGYQPERLRAGVYMMMYTIFASLPLLLVILSMDPVEETFFLDKNIYFSSCDGFMLTLGASLAFIVKLPLYLVHLWLPKAHVEAPVSGSMVLASVLLKLGGFGLIRMSPKIFHLLAGSSWILVSWSLMGGALVSILCLRQVDIKVLIALSSVAHMALVFGSILTLTKWGMNGALLVMLGHGFCSSGLFCIANMNYERSGTRSLAILKGQQAILPSLTLWWFLLVAANMAAPPSMNLIGEVSSIMGVVSWEPAVCVPIVGLTFFAVAYSLYMYTSTQHGKFSLASGAETTASVREHLVMILHLAPINFLVVKFSILQMYVCLASLFKVVACGAKEVFNRRTSEGGHLNVFTIKF